MGIFGPVVQYLLKHLLELIDPSYKYKTVKNNIKQDTEPRNWEAK